MKYAEAEQEQEQDLYSQRILNHFIGDVRGSNPGPTVIAVGGIHGNEPSGVNAVRDIIKVLDPLKEIINGRFIGLKGNLSALDENVRYVEEDMNRLWVTSILDKIRRTPYDQLSTIDRIEAKELLAVLDPLTDESTDEEVIYIDLHTFSGTGGMFCITPHEERHVQLLSQLRIPLVFGIEQALLGTSMCYVEERGHIGFAFESGTHGTKEAEENAFAGLLVLLASMGVIDAGHIEDFSYYFDYLMEKVAQFPHKLEVVYKHIIEEGDEFTMRPGFQNFDPVQKGDWLASDKHGKICAQADGFILMPLYQKKGTDGFFITREC